jgi:hypothetical protein
MIRLSTADRQRMSQLDAERAAIRKAAPRQKRPARVMPTAPGQRKPRQVDKDYKGFIAALPCVATLARTGWEAYGVQVAHVRFSDVRWGPNPGMGRKIHDWRTVPLSPEAHAEQHDGKERAFWDGLGIDVIDLCQSLRRSFPNHEQALAVLRDAARGVQQ